LLLILVAEFGDKTQIAVAAWQAPWLQSRYGWVRRSPWSWSLHSVYGLGGRCCSDSLSIVWEGLLFGARFSGCSKHEKVLTLSEYKALWAQSGGPLPGRKIPRPVKAEHFPLERVCPAG
jgi:hypothetical protein